MQADRTCSHCGVAKPLEAFNKDKLSVAGRTRRCKECVNEYRRARRHAGVDMYAASPEKQRRRREWEAGYRERNREAYRAKQIKARYGITVEDVEQMLVRQSGRCDICGDELRHHHIDHCHETGRVRGLLCGTCNRGLGQFKDNADRLIAAAVYLARHAD